MIIKGNSKNISILILLVLPAVPILDSTSNAASFANVLGQLLYHINIGIPYIGWEFKYSNRFDSADLPLLE